MRETAKPLFLTRQEPTLPVPNKIKLLIASIIFTLSYLSGKVPFFDDIDMTTKAQILVETTENDFSSNNTPRVNNEKVGQVQIKQISIGQKAYFFPTPTLTPLDTSNTPWGVAKKVDTYTYTMRLQPDSNMGTPGEILTALNRYRQRHGKGTLSWDDKLAGFANTRAEYFLEKGKLDSHAGFLDYLNNQDGFKKLGFARVGENSSIGFTLEGVHIIEWVYAGDAGHNDNQLNSDWQYVGIGVSSNATDLIFAGDKL